MEDTLPVIGGRTLTQISVLGTHDTFTYDLSTSIDTSKQEQGSKKGFFKTLL